MKDGTFEMHLTGGELDIKNFSGPLEMGHVLLCVGVRSEHLDEPAYPIQFIDGVGHFLVFKMAVAIDEKQVFPRLTLAGPGLDLGHVQPVFAERSHNLMQCPDLVLDPNDKAGAVILRGGTALSAEDEKARGVRGVVLDVMIQDLQVVTLRSE